MEIPDVKKVKNQSGEITGNSPAGLSGKDQNYRISIGL